jgi:RNA polymerase sigma factor (sigma-70 family)
VIVDRRIEDLLRELTPQVVGVLARRMGHFDECEDAVQEALLQAATQWADSGIPDNPRGWLITVALRRYADRQRSDLARHRREELAFRAHASAVVGTDADQDDTLTVLFLCCHPALSAPSQLALTLRAAGGLTTAEIARAFFVPEATMAQRISRAKQKIREAGATFSMPAEPERPQRLKVVLHVLYLIFNEGYTASAGDALHRVELTREAIRLARDLHRLLPEEGEVAGLLALMLLTDARRPARTDASGDLVPLAHQDRRLWNRDAIAEGVDLITRTLACAPLGPHQIQAAIAAVHDQAASQDETDWAEIVALYALLERFSPNPMVRLNSAVAVAMVDGPRAALEVIRPLESDLRMATNHRLAAVKAHLLEMAGDLAAARAEFRAAASRTSSIPEKRYLTAQATRLAQRAAPQRSMNT